MTLVLFMAYFQNLSHLETDLPDFSLRCIILDKLKITSILFVVFEILDSFVSYIGISNNGIQFEKNPIAILLINNFGIFSVILFKLLLSLFVLFFTFKLSKNFNAQEKTIYLFLLILMTMLALYGFTSAIYGLSI